MGLYVNRPSVYEALGNLKDQSKKGISKKNPLSGTLLGPLTLKLNRATQPFLKFDRRH